MIKCASIGMLDVAKINPVLQSANDVKNYDFITNDGDLYLVANELTGDLAHVDDVTIKAGDWLNGYYVKAWEGQELIVDGKHVAYAENKDYSDLAVNNLMTVDANGKLAVANAAPESGVYFKITKVGMKLTEAAVKVKVMVA
jgi:hypothetical protein